MKKKYNRNTKSSKNYSTKKFFDKVYSVVEKIPVGKVTTYGLIAEYCGSKVSARTVGWALNAAKNSNLPCHRVVNRFGALTGKIHFGDPELMKSLLIAEGVQFRKDDCVDLTKHLWNPKKNLR